MVNEKERDNKQIDNDKLKTILLNKGFKQIAETEVYYKQLENSTLYFDLDDDKMFYNVEDKKYNNYIIYFFKQDSIFYKKEYINKIVDDVVVKEFSYRNTEHFLKCDIGQCADYKTIYYKTAKIYNEIVN